MTAPGVPAAVAIDLGSTRIKAGVLTESGDLTEIVEVPAPPLRGSGEIRQGDAGAYADAAEGLLRGLPAGCPVGISSQRSTFHLWERDSGRAATPLISWQDRRAAGWCAAHRDEVGRVVRLTGLMLSAHYAGPKLAAIQKSDPGLAARLHRGELLFGNLETYLVWRATSGEVHATDPSMAARSSMFDIDAVDWSDELLELFQVPRGCLPRIEPTAGRGIDLGGGRTLRATVADQASGALAVLDPEGDDALVTLGTGGFVLKPLDGTAERLAGYLTAPCLGSARSIDRAVLEGTINGAGAMLDSLGGLVSLPDDDPTPDAFCLPDISGLGSPHWRPDLGLTFSAAARSLPDPDRRRIATEGLLFRIRQLMDDLYADAPPSRILLSGGVTRNPIVSSSLATLLPTPVHLLDQRQSALLGAARLAASLPPYAPPPTTLRPPSATAPYLPTKYPAWKIWLHSLL